MVQEYLALTCEDAGRADHGEVKLLAPLGVGLILEVRGLLPLALLRGRVEQQQLHVGVHVSLLIRRLHAAHSNIIGGIDIIWVTQSLWCVLSTLLRGYASLQHAKLVLAIEPRAKLASTCGSVLIQYWSRTMNMNPQFRQVICYSPPGNVEVFRVLEAHREIAGTDDLDSEHSLVLKGDDALGGSAHQLLALSVLRGLVLLLRVLARGLEGAVLDVALQRRDHLRKCRSL